MSSSERVSSFRTSELAVGCFFEDYSSLDFLDDNLLSLAGLLAGLPPEVLPERTSLDSRPDP